MTTKRQVFEMVVAVALAVVIATVVKPFFPETASTAGGVIAAMYFFSRYPWGGRPETNAQLDALFDEYLPFLPGDRDRTREPTLGDYEEQ